METMPKEGHTEIQTGFEQLAQKPWDGLQACHSGQDLLRWPQVCGKYSLWRFFCTENVFHHAFCISHPSLSHGYFSPVVIELCSLAHYGIDEWLKSDGWGHVAEAHSQLKWMLLPVGSKDTEISQLIAQYRYTPKAPGSHMLGEEMVVARWRKAKDFTPW